jgi:hypothetical protein
VSSLPAPCPYLRTRFPYLLLTVRRNIFGRTYVTSYCNYGRFEGAHLPRIKGVDGLTTGILLQTHMGYWWTSKKCRSQHAARFLVWQIQTSYPQVLHVQVLFRALAAQRAFDEFVHFPNVAGGSYVRGGPLALPLVGIIAQGGAVEKESHCVHWTKPIRYMNLARARQY